MIKDPVFCSLTKSTGRLAVSRGLGDFVFKKNLTLSPENQIMTANPDVTLHDITEEDEFLVLACDGKLRSCYLIVFPSRPCEGIWECLSSQQVVDFVRLKISEGKELREICENLCDFCLAPDTEPPPHKRGCSCQQCEGDYDENAANETGIGCDNMTVVIVAILHGRTNEDWYAWVTDRVKRKYGYATPTLTPQLYASNRLMSFKAQLERLEKNNPAAVQSGMPQSGTYNIVVVANQQGQSG